MSANRDSFDVIVLGSGISGLATALAAHEKGLRPLVLEKDDKVGGGTTESAGLIWVGNNHLMHAAGDKDSPEEIAAYTRFLAGGEEREENFKAFYDNADAAVRFFEDCGIKFQPTREIPDHYFGVAAGARAEGRSFEVELISAYDLGDWRSKVRMRPDSLAYVTCGEMLRWGGANRAAYWDAAVVKDRRGRDMRGQGVGLICHFLKALLKRGVPVRTGQTVERLAVEQGRVTGIVTRGGGEVTASRGVVIATGGYESNARLVRDLEGWESWISQFPPALTGDGLMLATEIGAAFRRSRNNMQLFLGYPIPPASETDEPRIQQAGIIEMHSPHTMVVNRAGKRFADEAYFQDVIPALRRFDPGTHTYPNVPCYLIFDAQYAAAYTFAGQAPGEPVPQWVAQADTLAGLADRLSVNAVELERTAARFNGFARAGRDDDFNRGGRAWRMASHDDSAGNVSLGTIEKPPFYGLELHPCGAGSVGILTNEWGQVLHQRQHPISGLYAIGNAAARTEFGAGYQAGLTLASGMTFGYLAATHMSHAQEKAKAYA